VRILRKWSAARDNPSPRCGAHPVCKSRREVSTSAARDSSPCGVNASTWCRRARPAGTRRARTSHAQLQSTRNVGLTPLRPDYLSMTRWSASMQPCSPSSCTCHRRRSEDRRGVVRPRECVGIIERACDCIVPDASCSFLRNLQLRRGMRRSRHILQLPTADAARIRKPCAHTVWPPRRNPCSPKAGPQADS